MRSGETFSINNSEKDREKSDEYYISEGVEYRNINKIDISTDQGKFEWLDSLVDNASARIESKQENIISEEGLYGVNKEEQEEYLKYNDAWQDNKLDFDIAKRQSKILENLDINGGGWRIRRIRTHNNFIQKSCK